MKIKYKLINQLQVKLINKIIIKTNKYKYNKN